MVVVRMALERHKDLGFTFDPISFVKRPTTILRLISWFFAVIIFGCISSGAYVENVCILKEEKNACGFGIFVGVVAFLGCLMFIAGDIMFEKISSVQHRKLIVVADLGFSGIWTFLYFIAFCFLANKWSNTSAQFLRDYNVEPWQMSNVRASIAFTFFSVASMAGLAYFAFLKYRQGAEGTFQTADQIEGQLQQGGGQTMQQPQPPYAGDTAGGAFHHQAQTQAGAAAAAYGDLSSGGQYQQGGY